jgi:hypothetical protein
MGFFSDAFGSGGSDPAKAADKYLSQIPGTITPYYQPYTQAGGQALGQYGAESNALAGMRPDLMQALTQLLQNPGNVYNQLGQGYQQSPGYEFNKNQNMQAITNAAAAGGMAGTPQHQMQAGAMASDLANQDFNQYLEHVMGLMTRGLSGGMGMYEQGFGGLHNLTNIGYQSSNDLASSLASNLVNQANNAYAGAANKNQRRGGALGAGLGFLGSLAGGAIGGPTGAYIGGMGGSALGRAF